MKSILTMFDRKQNKITSRSALEMIRRQDVPKVTVKLVEPKLPEYVRQCAFQYSSGFGVYFSENFFTLAATSLNVPPEFRETGKDLNWDNSERNHDRTGYPLLQEE